MADLEFLKTKWNFLYGLMDINKDGVLSRLDTDEVKTSFVAHHQLEGDAATKACGKIDQFWDKIVFREKQNESNPTVCCNDFVSSLVNSYVDNGQQLKDTMHQLTDISIEIADANGDGFVSFDELFGVYKCYGVNSSPTIKSLFELIGPNSEGLLPLDAVRSFWIEFLIGSDKKKFEEMKKAFGK